MHKLILIVVLVFLVSIGCTNDPINFGGEDVVNVQIKDSVFPDFSYAGFEKNDEAIPMVPISITISPGNKNDREAIQGAIDKLSTQPIVNGFRGAILLKRGEYFVDNMLKINKSGIVIRGEGQGENGTILHSTNVIKHQTKPQAIPFGKAMEIKDLSFILVQGQGSIQSQGERQPISHTVRSAKTEISIEDARSFQVGDTILIRKTTNEKWIDKVNMDQYGWTPAKYIFNHRRVIKDIQGNTLIVSIPMVDNIFMDEGGGTVEKINIPGRLKHVGIENLRIEADIDGPTKEHNLWTGIRFEGITNSWIRNVTALHFPYSAITVAKNSDFNTFQDVAMLEPVSIVLSPRRYHFNIESGMGNLFQRCYSEAGRHDFVVSSAKVGGPNVFFDCLAEGSKNDIGPHQRWSSGVLFDNISGSRLTAHNRGSAGSGHGWVGAQIMYWNSNSTQSFTVENPVNATNWCVGCTGAGLKGNGFWMSDGHRVSPRSLFLEQLYQRYDDGQVDKIIAPIQRSSTPIWEALRDWKGDENALENPFK